LRLHRVLQGEANQDDAAWIADAFAKWLAGDAVSVAAALRLPATRPFLLRVYLRDVWLVEAGRLILESESGYRGRCRTRWALAKRLRAAAFSFQTTKWLVWRRQVEPPWDRASPLDVAFFFALRSSDRLPDTERQFFDIAAPLFEMKAEDDFTRDARSSAA
jgi:hypothetical protein